MKRSRYAAALGLLAALSLVMSACGYTLQANRINDSRQHAGQPQLPTSSVLDGAAQAHTQAMCDAHAVSASPAGSYAQETAVATHELVGAAPLNPATTDATAREIDAANAIWAQWQGDAELVASKWTDMGLGEVTCSDDQLYMTAVLRQKPTVPATGLYTSPQYDASTIQSFLGIQYTTAVDYTGTTIPLLLDVYTPPAAAASPRPTIVLIHGGAFVGGSRTDMVGVAKQWVIRGYNAVSIDYRLDQTLYQDSSPPKQVAAATNATIDAEESVRWLKANAATYGVDVNRIAAVGYSAGGGISLGMSGAPDIARTGPNAAYSSTIAAAVSTGAYLTPAIDLGVLHLTAGLAPILMFHYETDVASNTGPYAFRTCSAYRAAGSTCDYVNQPGEGHTTDLTPGSVWWLNEIGPFIWQNLHLGS